MNLETMIKLLNEDLSREYSHWHFYIRAAAVVVGLHREEIGELFYEEAEGEMKHILEFQKLILGLGGRPTVNVADFNADHVEPRGLLWFAHQMEEEVVKNYTERIAQTEELAKVDPVNAKRIEIFLEDQLMDSRDAVDNYKEMMR